MHRFGESFLDYLDLYKLTMLQFIWRRYRTVNVRFALTNRTTSVRLAEVIPQEKLRDSLRYVETLSFLPQEIAWLRGLMLDEAQPIFCEEFLEWLAQLRLSDFELSARSDGQYNLSFPGTWPEATLWETAALSSIASLYTFHKSEGNIAQLYEEGERRFLRKVSLIKTLPQRPIITEFGTRRRASADWHEIVLGLALYHLGPYIVGTSNLGLARKYNLRPQGTMAHELFMVKAALAQSDEELRNSQSEVLSQWWDEYGAPLSIILPDTFGSDFSFATMGRDIALNWKGTRQDSGPPDEYAPKCLSWYRKQEVDARSKSLVFSDGLDAQTIVTLDSKYMELIQPGYGWGTNLTNDVGIKPLSLVVKVVEANGRPTVKMSDNLAKATGPREEVDRYKRVFGYTSTLNESCRY